MKQKKIKGYYFVTDAGLSRRGTRRDVSDAAAAGACAVQLRMKNRADKVFLREAIAVRRTARPAYFIVNDRVDIALASGADGVHLGCEDMPPALARLLLGENIIIGVSVRDARGAIKAVRDGADYVAVSPVFVTATKPDAVMPCGLKALKTVKKVSSVPVVAIGGISLDNVRSVIASGADAVCAISAVLNDAEPLAAMKRFRGVFKNK
jgi:thiamine-phosphate pyrophosphorylase